MNKVLSLDDYFNNTKYAISFFDVQIKKLEITKEALLSSLEIPYMSYRRSRVSDRRVGKGIIEKLENYFKMNPVNSQRKEEYELILNTILRRFYYRGDHLSEYESVLTQYIQENNFLQPIFELFLLLIQLVSTKSPKLVIEEKRIVFKELEKYKKNYFISPLLEIYVIIEILFSGSNLMEFNKELTFADSMKGILYYVYTSNAYLAKNYDLCLYYAKECREYLLKDFNFKRIITVNLTYFACLNMIGEYERCRKESEKQLIYLKENEESHDFIYFTEMHYYTACVGGRFYNEVIDALLKKEKYTCYDYIFLLLASKNNSKNLFKNIINKYYNSGKNSTELSSKHKEYIELVIHYLTNNKRSLAWHKIEKSQLNIGIKEILYRLF